MPLLPGGRARKRRTSIVLEPIWLQACRIIVTELQATFEIVMLGARFAAIAMARTSIHRPASPTKGARDMVAVVRLGLNPACVCLKCSPTPRVPRSVVPTRGKDLTTDRGVNSTFASGGRVRTTKGFDASLCRDNRRLVRMHLTGPR